MCGNDWNTIASWVLAGLNLLTLGVLCFYAWDTRRIADAAQRQSVAATAALEAQSRPVLVVEHGKNDNSGAYNKLYLRNVGSGVALNVRWNVKTGPVTGLPTFHSFIPQFEDTTPIFVGDIKNVEEQQQGKLAIDYESLSSKHYRTDVCIAHGSGESWVIRLTCSEVVAD